MADQKKITLRQTHATPKNIILRELPVSMSTSTFIRLLSTHATPKNIILRNPLAEASSEASVLVIQDATLAVTFDNLDLVQHQALSIQDLILASNIGNLELTQHHVLTVQDLVLGITIENLILTADNGQPIPQGSGSVFLKRQKVKNFDDEEWFIITR